MFQSKKHLLSLVVGTGLCAAFLVTAGCNTSKKEASTEALATETGSTESAKNIISYPDPSIRGNLPDEKPYAGEDFYLSINYDEIKNTTLPDGMSQYGCLNEIIDQERDDMLSLLNGDEEGDEKLNIIRSLYDQYLDNDQRNERGWDSIKDDVTKIEEADSVKELLSVLSSNSVHWDMMGLFTFTVTADLKNSSKNVIYLGAPELDLSDSAEYAKMTDYGKLYKDADDVFYKKLLKKYGYSEEEAATMVEDQFNWETKLSSYIYATEVSYRDDYEELTYNPYEAEELKTLTGDFPVEEILSAIGADGQNKYIIDQPDYFKALSSLVTDENLSLLKANSIIHLLSFASMYTDEEAYGYYNDWVNTKNGSSGMKEAQYRAYTFLGSILPELTGDVYAANYFSKEEKSNVEEILLNIKAALRDRLEKADWMSENTRNTAIEKLDTMEYYVGYPEMDFYDYSTLEIDKGNDLYTNVLMISENLNEQLLSAAGEDVNNAAWGTMMAANVLNACYIPTANSIYFPAAILTAPFYDKDNTPEQNYGGIGAVMGHEMTHAFDTEGSQYDKDGNMVNWWTDEDRAAFKKLTAKVGERYGSYNTIDDLCVNGDLTIGETVADLGGFAASMDALKKNYGEDEDYAAMFTQLAKLWRVQLTKEWATYRLKNDPHAPNCLRTNVTLAQFDEFYEAFGIKEGDFMYTAPEDRLKVW